VGESYTGKKKHERHEFINHNLSIEEELEPIPEKVDEEERVEVEWN